MASDVNDWSYADAEEETLTRIAWYYYNDGMTQGEIGEKLGLSRIKVSRLLESGRRTGIIQVRINSRYQGCLEHEQRLQDAWGLREVRVVPHLENGDLNERLGQAAAQFLMQRLGNDDLLAVGWGRLSVTPSSALVIWPMNATCRWSALLAGSRPMLMVCARQTGAAAFICCPHHLLCPRMRLQPPLWANRAYPMFWKWR